MPVAPIDVLLGCEQAIDAAVFSDPVERIIGADGEPAEISGSERSRFHAGGALDRDAEDVRLEAEQEIV